VIELWVCNRDADPFVVLHTKPLLAKEVYRWSVFQGKKELAIATSAQIYVLAFIDTKPLDHYLL